MGQRIKNCRDFKDPVNNIFQIMMIIFFPLFYIIYKSALASPENKLDSVIILPTSIFIRGEITKDIKNSYRTLRTFIPYIHINTHEFCFIMLNVRLLYH